MVYRGTGITMLSKVNYGAMQRMMIEAIGVAKQA
jgi:hypothetical protein